MKASDKRQNNAFIVVHGAVVVETMANVQNIDE